MKVSISWLKELVVLKVSIEELIRLLPLRTIGLKEVTKDFIELDMKGYNRADLLSMRGVAREVAAITNSEVQFSDTGWLEHSVPETNVKVENPKLCPVYCIAKIENLKVESSDDTWVKKLNDSGIRAINNIADVTNLIMLEYGQPMHVFDANKVAGETLIVRVAKPGETLVTLDGKTRNLNSADLLIADLQKPLGIAGVMGGKESEVSDSTTSILLEAAIFDPISIRKSSQKHGLYSEASKRFQHGLTKTNLLQALYAAIKIYEDLGGKLTAITLTGNLEDKTKKITLTQQKVNSLLGIEIPKESVESSLNKLGFFTASQEDSWEAIVPYWRLDIEIEEDLIEEVARMYGYEKIPPQELRGKLPEKVDQKLPNLIYNLKKSLADIGLTEVQTYSFYSTKVLVTCNFALDTLLKISNPISSETEYLRNYLWPNLVEVISKNIKQGYSDIAIFEIGKIYRPKKNDLPEEKYHLAIALMNGSDNPMTELNVILNKAKNLLRIQEGSETSSGILRSTQDDNLFHPKRVTENMAETHPRFLNKFGIEKRVAIMELEINYSVTETCNLLST